MIPGAVLAVAVTDPQLVQSCGPKGQQAWLCSTVYRITGSSDAAEVADALAKPLRIVFILVVAFVVVRISRRMIQRTVLQLSGAAAKVRPANAGVALIDTSPLPDARRVQRANTIGSLLRSVVAITVWSIAIITILSDLGVDLAPLIAGAGIIGIALGFGAQSLVRDFLSGLFMLMEDQYGVGDVIDVGVTAGNVIGTVEGVSLRTTRLRDLDGVVWHVPNGTITRVGNKSQQWARAVVDVEVAYAADLAQATEVIRQVADELWHEPSFDAVILAEPTVLGVEALGAARAILRVVVRTRPQEQWRVARELRLRIKTAFDAAGIEMPST